MKVKIFQFTVCCGRYISSTHEFELEEMNTGYVERTINKFIKGKQVVSITPSVIEERFHNNGGYNTVSIVYTILYEDDGQ